MPPLTAEEKVMIARGEMPTVKRPHEESGSRPRATKKVKRQRIKKDAQSANATVVDVIPPASMGVDAPVASTRHYDREREAASRSLEEKAEALALVPEAPGTMSTLPVCDTCGDVGEVYHCTRIGCERRVCVSNAPIESGIRKITNFLSRLLRVIFIRKAQ
ncbi:hypothetical protein BV22DRAFT_546112 [Leucogyrophana mollusca]|uniref:Uncharacterized protein n=1 Tax=Leucogyrophana mollusca TaxID=85980 RepID=A0ACB8BFK1_9AGAM|nr:hypothetical protein BV22DRAFT_546112 [Leucogyrophana mollusca]